MPSRVFALTLLDTFAPPDDDAKSHDLLAQARRALASKDSPQPVRGFIVDALSHAQGDVARFRQALERPFDEVMDRASGWYKRRVQIIMFCIALVLAVAVNADTFAIGQRLWKDDALRTAVVAQVNKGQTAACADQGGSRSPVDRAAACVDQVRQLKLPIGWSGAPARLGVSGQADRPPDHGLRAHPRSAVLVRPARQGRAAPRQRTGHTREGAEGRPGRGRATPASAKS